MKEIAFKHFVFTSALISLVVQIGCNSVEARSSSPATRAPSATDAAYPLNPKFEVELPNEDQVVSQIRDGILYLQGKEAHDHGADLRGTHAKGICALADFEVYDVSQTNGAVAPRIKKGIFSVPGRYSAQVRFANADGSINRDQKNDVRALSFSAAIPPSLSNPEGAMDFAMNNASTFPIGNAQIFADLMTFAKNPKSLATMNPKNSAAVIGALGLGEIQKYESRGTPYQKMRYWSTVPFALGDDEAVKYSLKPCADNAAQPLTHDPNALSNELTRHLQDDKPSCFDFQVQLLEPDRMTNLLGHHFAASHWVENAELDWPESEAPFYTVGRLTLRAKSVLDAPTCEKWRINVLAHNNETHHGLGSINRARTKAENASAAARMSH